MSRETKLGRGPPYGPDLSLAIIPDIPSAPLHSDEIEANRCAVAKLSRASFPPDVAFLPTTTSLDRINPENRVYL